MRNRFLLEGEYQDTPVYLAIAFEEGDTKIDLYAIDKKVCKKATIEQWIEDEAALPEHLIYLERTTKDENLLPEDIRVKDVGKVRSIEIAWANSLFHSKMLQSFEGELALIKDKVLTLDGFNQDVYDEASNFWERVLSFKQENASVNTSKITLFKNEIDLLFEALKALRKDQKKELNEKAKEIKADLLLKLELIEHKLQEKLNYKFISDRLKEVRQQLNKSGLKNKDYAEIDQKINLFFDQMSKERAESNAKKYDKRIHDLQEISEKMQKSIDWDKKQLSREEKNKDYSTQKFQVKLIETKIAMIETRIEEKSQKLKDINATLQSLKKKAGIE